MKKFIVSILLVFALSNYVNADTNTNLILQEISQLRADMNKRFEQVDKRLNFLEQLFYVMMGLVFASPFLAFYIKERSEGKMQALIFALREAAQKDENLAKAIKIAGLD